MRRKWLFLEVWRHLATARTRLGHGWATVQRENNGDSIDEIGTQVAKLSARRRGGPDVDFTAG
jgi:hypothetical protein